MDTKEVNSKYTPETSSRRSGVALCLSGGGFRASLLHLGGLRRLNEQGILSKLDTVASVSGGSIVAAHVADRLRPWPAPGSVVSDWEEKVARPFRDFAARNHRTGPVLVRFLPWNWLRPRSRIDALEARFQKNLTNLKLAELPESRPKFVFCATDMAFGVNWVFERDRVGDYRAGYITPAPDWPVARAVAASSCYPPVFSPMPLSLRPGELVGGTVPAGRERDKLVSGLELTDGGVYDNMGLEPAWKAHQVVLVSDGGATFEFESTKNPLKQLGRYIAIVANQASGVRKRWLIANFINEVMSGTYWGTGSAADKYGSSDGYSKPLAKDIIARIRSDIDAFSEGEIKVLENHGYLLAEAAISRHVSTLVEPGTTSPNVPHPDWMDETRVRSALKNSHKRCLLGRR